VSARFPETVKPQLILGGFPVAKLKWDATPMLLDPMNQAHDHFGVKDACLYLIRPDLYIGFRGKLKDSYLLTEYMNRVLVPAERAAHGA
jgi:hypothetical protein